MASTPAEKLEALKPQCSEIILHWRDDWQRWNVTYHTTEDNYVHEIQATTLAGVTSHMDDDGRTF